MTFIAQARNRPALIKAAQGRYEANLDTPDRPGWKGRKCPRNEYFGIVAESGAADFVGASQESMCFYSTDQDEYTKADIYINGYGIEVKAGDSFRDKDFDVKGADIILFVNPLATHYTKCTHCAPQYHPILTGAVEIKGWITADDERKDMGNYYFPVTLRDPASLLDYIASKEVAA